MCVLLHKYPRLTIQTLSSVPDDVLGKLQRQNRVRVRRGNGKTETELRKKRVKGGKAGKRVKGGEAEKRVKGGKAEKKLKGGKAEKRVKGGKKCKTRIKCHFKLYY